MNENSQTFMFRIFVFFSQYDMRLDQNQTKKFHRKNIANDEM